VRINEARGLSSQPGSDPKNAACSDYPYFSEVVKAPQGQAAIELQLISPIPWSEINGSGYSVVKLYLQDKGSNDLQRADRMDRMAHGFFSLSKWLDLKRGSASLQSLPVVQQLGLMDLGPGFHEALLPTWQATSNEFDPVDGDYCDIILAIGMKVVFVVPELLTAVATPPRRRVL